MSDEDVFGDDFSTETPAAETPATDDGGQASGGGNYAQELVSKKVRGRQRTFYIDLKESSNGKFVKMSELSRGGQRSTIMFDEEDIGEIIIALEEIKAAL
jgi:hypothetical protein